MSFFEGKEVVVTEKMDGENTSIYRDHYHARSLDSPYHPSRTYVGKLQGRVGWQVPEGWRICGENMYAKHSIKYTSLEDYFLVFSIWNADNVCLSWDETLEWCELLDLTFVPVLYRGKYNEDLFRGWTEESLNSRSPDPVEGYVIRTAGSFAYEDFTPNVAKWVRKGHVQPTEGHWMSKQVEPNELK
jgi:hypothetical protein